MTSTVRRRMASFVFGILVVRPHVDYRRPPNQPTLSIPAGTHRTQRTCQTQPGHIDWTALLRADAQESTPTLAHGPPIRYAYPEFQVAHPVQADNPRVLDRFFTTYTP